MTWSTNQWLQWVGDSFSTIILSGEKAWQLTRFGTIRKPTFVILMHYALGYQPGIHISQALYFKNYWQLRLVKNFYHQILCHPSFLIFLNSVCLAFGSLHEIFFKRIWTIIRQKRATDSTQNPRQFLKGSKEIAQQTLVQWHQAPLSKAEQGLVEQSWAKY